MLYRAMKRHFVLVGRGGIEKLYFVVSAEARSLCIMRLGILKVLMFVHR